MSREQNIADLSLLEPYTDEHTGETLYRSANHSSEAKNAFEQLMAPISDEEWRKLSRPGDDLRRQATLIRAKADALGAATSTWPGRNAGAVDWEVGQLDKRAVDLERLADQRDHECATPRGELCKTPACTWLVHRSNVKDQSETWSIEDWEDGAECTRCHTSLLWEGDMPESADDAICHDCAWKELKALRAEKANRAFCLGCLVNQIAAK